MLVEGGCIQDDEVYEQGQQWYRDVCTYCTCQVSFNLLLNILINYLYGRSVICLQSTHSRVIVEAYLGQNSGIVDNYMPRVLPQL